MQHKIENVLIIGSGPAGYTAAIYASRANLNPKLIAGNQPGGQLTTTTEVENFPGYPQGVDGTQLMADLKNQAERFNTKIINENVLEITHNINKTHEIKTNKNIYITKSVIICTGATPKKLGISDEIKYYGNGLSYCATCDGFFYKNKNVIVVGGGDTACEEAIYLSNICNKVYMIIRKDHMKASQVMQKRVNNKNNIDILFNSQLINIKGSAFVEKAIIKNNLNNINKELNIDGIFIAIGHIPNSDILKFVDKDSNGYILTKNKSSITNIKGIFAAGDVQDPIYKQAITASAAGCIAALDAEKYLQSFT